MNGLVHVEGLLATIELPGLDEILYPMNYTNGGQHQEGCQAQKVVTLLKTQTIGQK